MLKLFVPSHLVAVGVVRDDDTILMIDEDIEVADDLLRLVRPPLHDPDSSVSMVCPKDVRRCGMPSYQALTPCLADKRYCNGGFVGVRAGSSAAVAEAYAELATQLFEIKGYISTVADQDLINLFYRTRRQDVSLYSCEWNCVGGPVPQTGPNYQRINLTRAYLEPMRCPGPCKAVHWSHFAWRTQAGRRAIGVAGQAEAAAAEEWRKMHKGWLVAQVDRLVDQLFG